MTIAKWTITLYPRSGVELTDAECEQILTALEWFEGDVESFIESKLPAKLVNKVKVNIND